MAEQAVQRNYLISQLQVISWWTSCEKAKFSLLTEVFRFCPLLAWLEINEMVLKSCKTHKKVANGFKFTKEPCRITHGWMMIRWFYILVNLSHLMTKPTKWVCAQRRLPSLIILHCSLNGLLRTQAFFMQTAKALIRVGGCPGWSESSLGAHAVLMVLSCRGSFQFQQYFGHIWTKGWLWRLYALNCC